MREIKIKLYRYDELSESAQIRAWEDYNKNGLDFLDGSDFRDTLKAFEDLFNIRVYSWNVDSTGYGFRYCKGWQWDDGDDYFKNPFRFAKWVWNNWADKIQAPKVYGRLTTDPATKKTVYKRRESKTTVTYDCTLTGFYVDCDIIAPILDCIHYKKEYYNMGQVFDDCLDSFFTAWQKGYEYYESREYFAETAAANEWEFTEYGELWNR